MSGSITGSYSCLLPSSLDVRGFQVLKILLDANDFTEIIDWQTCRVSEPPITAFELSDEDLEAVIASVDAQVVDFPKFSCHTQAVERSLKLKHLLVCAAMRHAMNLYALGLSSVKHCRRLNTKPSTS